MNGKMPRFFKQLSSPVSLTAEVRSLQLHHLEPVKEDKNLESESAPETAYTLVHFDLFINREDRVQYAATFSWAKSWLMAGSRATKSNKPSGKISFVKFYAF
jgi:hypothetical protein